MLLTRSPFPHQMTKVCSDSFEAVQIVEHLLTNHVAPLPPPPPIHSPHPPSFSPQRRLTSHSRNSQTTPFSPLRRHSPSRRPSSSPRHRGHLSSSSSSSPLSSGLSTSDEAFLRRLLRSEKQQRHDDETTPVKTTTKTPTMTKTPKTFLARHPPKRDLQVARLLEAYLKKYKR